MSQAGDILDYLNRNGSITRAEAFYELGIAELSARIIDLEGKGHAIPRERIQVEARNGRKCTVTKYLQPSKQKCLIFG